MESVQQYPEIFINGETEDSLKKGAAKIVNLIKPSWKKDDFQYKIFTDGISNKLIGVYIGNVKADMVLVRVYGAKTELIIDRTAEVRNMTVLNQVGCGCQLYAQFGNGLAYEFLPGEIYITHLFHLLNILESNQSKNTDVQLLSMTDSPP